MGQINPFRPEKLVLPVLISDPAVRPLLLDRLRVRFGEIDYTSVDLPFRQTRYYDEQMGVPITRFFLSFRELVDPGALSGIKIETNRIEAEHLLSARRRVNLDPGLLSLSRFILASTKDGSHRVPLGEGIYAEITLVYERGQYRPLEWTYPDYRSDEYRSILEEIRTLYKAQLRGRALRAGTPASRSPRPR